MKMVQPDYKRIYLDIIAKKIPENKEKCLLILEKKSLSFFDILKINSLIFPITDKNKQGFSQKYKSYNEATILEILTYQRKNGLNNTELSHHFKLSRNTVAKWKKMYGDH
ncbi:helix-turn-helix domain-containing protein [Chryseobacterium sp.]|uniref:helix-turn-helix domain-containing protein n=1 Tax=Chryseobacterium sp. TaxID=1871047 RepID=UPI000ED2B01D|nr:helix-turn-helix domain-containing protein [Chryseobacterium sp.]HCA09429.1 transposase [Chryseobacterium sp.]